MTKKKRKKKTKNLYFNDYHEKAICRYIDSDDKSERDEIYSKIIRPTFNEMVDKIVFTYRFNSLPNIDSLKQDCKVWLTTVIDKYDPEKGSKAFSYFSVITKNWFIQKTKVNSKKNQQEILCEDLSKELEQEHLTCNENYMSFREYGEFWQFLFMEIDEWEYDDDIKDVEKKVLLAIQHILSEGVSDIEIYNKKAIYLYIREYTHLNTKQVASSLQKIRNKYKEFKKDWNNSEI